MAITKITELKSAIAVGARSNLFEVSLSVPTNNADLTALNARFTYLCKGAQLPGSTLGLIDVPFMAGRRYKLAGDRTFVEWTTTVLNDQDFVIRKALEDIQRIYGATNYDAPTSKTKTGAATGDFNTITVKQYDQAGSAKYTYTLFNAWPSEISTIDLAYDSVDTIEEFTCTWSYDYFTFASGTQSNPNASSVAEPTRP